VNEKRAREILGSMIRGDDMNEWLYAGDIKDTYVGECGGGVVLDGFFTPETLRAIAWFVENKGEK